MDRREDVERKIEYHLKELKILCEKISITGIRKDMFIDDIKYSFLFNFVDGNEEE